MNRKQAETSVDLGKSNFTSKWHSMWYSMWHEVISISVWCQLHTVCKYTNDLDSFQCKINICRFDVWMLTPPFWRGNDINLSITMTYISLPSKCLPLKFMMKCLMLTKFISLRGKALNAIMILQSFCFTLWINEAGGRKQSIKITNPFFSFPSVRESCNC